MMEGEKTSEEHTWILLEDRLQFTRDFNRQWEKKKKERKKKKGHAYI